MLSRLFSVCCAHIILHIIQMTKKGLVDMYISLTSECFVGLLTRLPRDSVQSFRPQLLCRDDKSNPVSSVIRGGGLNHFQGARESKKKSKE